MLGPRLAQLVTDDHARRALVAYARSLVSGAELDPSERARADELRGALEAMYLMAAADGEIGTEELVLLTSSVQAMLESAEGRGLSRLELGLPLLKLDREVARCAEALEKDGLSPRLAEVARAITTPEARRLAFRLAAGVAFADDFVAHGEAEALDAFGDALGLSQDEQLGLLKEVHAALA